MKRIVLVFFALIFVSIFFGIFEKNFKENLNDPFFKKENLNIFFLSSQNSDLYNEAKTDIISKNFKNFLVGVDGVTTNLDINSCNFCYKKQGSLNIFYTKEIHFKKENISKIKGNNSILIIEESLDKKDRKWETQIDLESFKYIIILTNGKFFDKKNLIYINPYSEKLLEYIKFYKRKNGIFVAKESIKSKLVTTKNWNKIKDTIPIYELKFDENEFKRQWEKLPKRKITELRWTLWNSNNKKFKAIATTIKIGNVWKKGKVKIRGEVDNHWVNVKKSFNVKLKDSINGHTLLKFIMAEDRGILYNYLYKSAITNGAIHPKTELVWLRVNGKDLGAYYLFEPLDKAFLEVRGFSGDSFIYKNEWEDQCFGRMIKVFKDLSLFSKFAANKTNENFKSEMEILYQAIENNDLVSLKNIIDIKSFINWYVNIIYWGDVHQNDFDNLRLIYDSTAGRFLFITWDPSFNTINKEDDLFRSASSISDILIKDEDIKERIISKIKFRVTDKNNIEREKNIMKAVYKEAVPVFLADKYNAVLNINPNYGLKILEENINKLKKMINPLNLK